tara:strand:+ start:84 stop:689 length:606 start_codon:yes stop_codon:yes gene_type:complete
MLIGAYNVQVVENRMTELLASSQAALVKKEQELKDMYNKELNDLHAQLTQEMEKNEKMRETMSKIRKSSSSKNFEKRISAALQKTEKELKATVSKLVAAEVRQIDGVPCVCVSVPVTRVALCCSCGLLLLCILSLLVLLLLLVVLLLLLLLSLLLLLLLLLLNDHSWGTVDLCVLCCNGVCPSFFRKRVKRPLHAWSAWRS